MSETELYLIWSHEHSMWWKSYGGGYARKLGEAGLYSRRAALDICARALTGTGDRMQAFPEIPVRQADIAAVRDAYEAKYPGHRAGNWEKSR